MSLQSQKVVTTVYFPPKQADQKNVLPSSLAYTEEDVLRLKAGVESFSDAKFICFTNEKIPGVETRPFKLPYRDYWICMEPFNTDVGDMLFVGLDTVITGSLDDLFSYSGNLGLMSDPYRPHRAGNFIVRCKYRPDIWEQYYKEPDVYRSRHKNEMEYLEGFEHDRLDHKFPGQVLSYKAHVQCGRDASDARIIYFHGQPKPRDVGWQPLQSQP